MRRFAVALALLALLPPAARAEDGLPSVKEGWRPPAERLVENNRQRAVAAGDPLLAPMAVCSGTACAHASEVELGEDQAAMIRNVFGPGAEDQPTERAMIARAIAQFETFVGAMNGTWRDHARNAHDGEDQDGQMDCVSESVNTRTYLDRLAQAGLLRHHRVAGFVHRYLMVLQHVAVELVERETGEAFVVDSWEGDNGEEPAIAPYLSWRMEFLV